jgi:hypothetical protein
LSEAHGKHAAPIIDLSSWREVAWISRILPGRQKPNLDLAGRTSLDAATTFDAASEQQHKFFRQVVMMSDNEPRFDTRNL